VINIIRYLCQTLIFQNCYTAETLCAKQCFDRGTLHQRLSSEALPAKCTIRRRGAVTEDTKPRKHYSAEAGCGGAGVSSPRGFRSALEYTTLEQ